jgi:hypothetical protein
MSSGLSGGYLAGGFVKSIFLPTDLLEWYLSPTVKKIEWPRDGSRVHAGSLLAILTTGGVDSEIALPYNTSHGYHPP